MIYSFNQRHPDYIKATFPEFVFPSSREECREALIKKFGKEIQFLGYYEHGDCVWFLEGEGGPGTDCQFDGVKFAGVWVPDAKLKVKPRAKELRADILKELAREECKRLTAEYNGTDEGD